MFACGKRLINQEVFPTSKINENASFQVFFFNENIIGQDFFIFSFKNVTSL